MSKSCSICCESKPLTEFHKNNSCVDGRHSQCRACIGAKKRSYYIRSKQQKADYGRRRYVAKRDEIRAQSRQYYRANQKTCLERHRKWVENNPEKVHAYKARARELQRQRNQRYRKNPEWVVLARCRSRLTNFLRKVDAPKRGTTQQYIGLSPAALRSYLEFLMEPGMTWENYGVVWHLDHFIPLSWADPLNDADLRTVMHFSNLQPKWASENLSKSNRYCG
jgi:hypothetical protein